MSIGGPHEVLPSHGRLDTDGNLADARDRGHLATRTLPCEVRLDRTSGLTF